MGSCHALLLRLLRSVPSSFKSVPPHCIPHLGNTLSWQVGWGDPGALAGRPMRTKGRTDLGASGWWRQSGPTSASLQRALPLKTMRRSSRTPGFCSNVSMFLPRHDLLLSTEHATTLCATPRHHHRPPACQPAGTTEGTYTHSWCMPSEVMSWPALGGKDAVRAVRQYAALACGFSLLLAVQSARSVCYFCRFPFFHQTATLDCIIHT